MARSLPLLLSLFAALLGCGRGEGGRTSLSIRFVDRPEAVRVAGPTGAGDLARPETWEALHWTGRRPVETFAPEGLRAHRPEGTQRGAFEWVSDAAGRTSLSLSGPIVAWLDLEPGVGGVAPFVRLLASVDEAWDGWIFLQPARGEEDAPDLGARLWRGGGEGAARLEPEGKVVPGRPVWYSRAPASGGAYRLVLVVRAGSMKVSSVERARLSPVGSALARSAPLPGRPAFVRRLASPDDPTDFREALLVPLGGGLEVDVGEEAPRSLRFAWAALGPAGSASLRCLFAVSGGEETALWSSSDGPAPRRFAEVALSLPPGAGTLRFRFERSGGPILAALAHPTLVPPPPPRRPPDVVLVSLDTVRADRLSLYGAHHPTSPHLERLAATSVVFENAIAPSSWTLPTHVTVFSGWLPDRHDVIDGLRRMPDHAPPLLAEALRAAGYRCVALTAGGYLAPEFGFARGFEEYRTADPVEPRHLADGPMRAFSAAERERLLELLSRPQRGEPLFLFVHTYVAHEYAPLREDLEALGLDPARIERALSVDVARARARYAEEGVLPPEWLRALSWRYDATLREADRLVGEIVSALERGGRLDRTILAVFSDHGEELGDHGGFGHSHALHEELIRVPWLLRGPGIAPRRVVQVVSLADLAPTLLDLLGIERWRTDGRSLAPLLHGGTLEPHPALAACGTPTSSWLHALRGRRWKLVRNEQGGRRIERLFDLEGAAEERDVARDEPQTLRRLSRALDRWVEELRAGRLGAVESVLDRERRRELERLGYLGGD